MKNQFLHRFIVFFLFLNLTHIVYAMDDHVITEQASKTADDKAKDVSDVLEVFDVYYKYFSGMLFKEQPNLIADCNFKLLSNPKEGWCYYDYSGVSFVQDMFCDNAFFDRELDYVRKEIKEKIKYTITDPKQKRCFCQTSPKKYSDNSDECILERRKVKDYEDIYYFDYKKYLPSDLQYMTPSMFKEYTKTYHVVELFRRNKCLDNMELISTEREECSKKLDTYMVDVLYQKYPKCIKRPTYKIYTTHERVNAKPEIDKIIFEMENKCIL